MFEKLKNKLRQIQESDEQTKRRWLVGLSALAMVVVFGLWIVSLNYAIEKTDKAADAEKPEETNFWQVFSAGLKSISGAVQDGMKNLKNEAISDLFIEVEQ